MTKYRITDFRKQSRDHKKRAVKKQLFREIAHKMPVQHWRASFFLS